MTTQDGPAYGRAAGVLEDAADPHAAPEPLPVSPPLRALLEDLRTAYRVAPDGDIEERHLRVLVRASRAAQSR